MEIKLYIFDVNINVVNDVILCYRHHQEDKISTMTSKHNSSGMISPFPIKSIATFRIIFKIGSVKCGKRR